MGKANKALFDFIDDIPDEKLTGDFGGEGGTIYSDRDFRLDMQGMTTGGKAYNLQIQVNKGTTISTLKKFAPKTASHVEVDVDANLTADELRRQFKANAIF